MTHHPSPEGTQDEALRVPFETIGPPALAIADWLDAVREFANIGTDEAASELRRLHARVQEQQTELMEQARLLGISAEREMALRARVQELERERDNYKLAHDEWAEKTHWVQQTAQPHELGVHRADVLRDRINRAAAAERKECAAHYLAIMRGAVVAEREACLRLAERRHLDSPSPAEREWYQAACKGIAADIRARGAQGDRHAPAG